MLNLADIFELKPNEQVHQVLRRHASTLWWQLLIAGLLIVTPFFFLFLLPKWQTVGTLFFALSEALGLFIAIRAFLRWDSTVLVLTTHRACYVVQDGLWKRQVCDTPLSLVKSASWERNGLLERLWRTGTLKIVTGSDVTVVVPTIVHPEQAQALLNQLREKQAWQADEPANVERMMSMEELLNKADVETLRAVEQLLREHVKSV